MNYMTDRTKIVVKMDAGIVGTDATEFWEVPTRLLGTTELDDFAWERGVQHAEMYGVYFPSEDSDEDDESCSYDISGYWELYVPEKHDGERVGNDSSWQKY